jgi:electron transport complex protein RnfC
MLEYSFDRNLSGGLRLPANKLASTAASIRRGFVPRELVLPMRQHRGTAAEPIVSVGDRVRKAQMIGAPQAEPSAAVHASSSGRVVAIEERPVIAASGVETSLCVVVQTDGRDELEPAQTDWPADRAAQLDAVRRGGIVGLGGAAFPSAAKLRLAPACKMLIVNGAECEPYISCDDMLMREAPREIVAGALALTELVAAPLCVLAIERDKPRAVEAIKTAARALGDPRFKVAEVPTIYPAGGERQLVELLTAEEVPSTAYPSDIGYVCHNVGTAYAVHRLKTAHEPLIGRIVTVTGRGIAQPQNVEAPLGTPIKEIVELCGGYVREPLRLICGGSMMGCALDSDELPVGKATNCIIVATAEEIRTERAEWECIRCGDCAAACPARLLPQELLTAARAADYDALALLGLRDCIECGCCDVSCPSQIMLTERFRQAKRDYALHERDLKLSAEAEARFQRREQRLTAASRRETEVRTALKTSVRDTASRREAIEAALRRAAERHPDRDQPN